MKDARSLAFVADCPKHSANIKAYRAMISKVLACEDGEDCECREHIPVWSYRLECEEAKCRFWCDTG